MKSIRTKITLCLILTVLAGQAASGFASIIPSYNSTMDTVEQMLEGGELSVSEHSLRLLEHERMKYQFFATLSHIDAKGGKIRYGSI